MRFVDTASVFTSPLVHAAVDSPFRRASNPSRWNGGWLTMSSSVSSVTSRKLAFTLPLVCRSVSTFVTTTGRRRLLVALALLLALCWFDNGLNYGRTRKRRNPVVQQDLAFQLSARLQSSRHVRYLQMQWIGMHTRVQANAARHHSGPNVRRIVRVHSSVDAELSILPCRAEVELCDSLRREGITQALAPSASNPLRPAPSPSNADG